MKIIVINARGQEFLNWITIGTTIGAITQHAYMEINEKGTIDPEVMSIMYLINSIGIGNMPDASLVTWITTFGRHIVSRNRECFIIKIDKNEEKYNNNSYDISILESGIISKNLNQTNIFTDKVIETQNRNSKGQFMLRQGNFNNMYF